MKKTFDKTRRDFMKAGSAALAGAYLGFYAPSFIRVGPRAKPTPNMQFRSAGATGLKISEVGFGAFSIRDPRVVEYALDQGVNYIDTAYDYLGGMSETVIGKAIKSRRDEYVLTTKWHPWSYTTAAEMMESLNTSLRRLQTDHVEFLLVHQVGRASGGEGIERLQNQELFKAIQTAKQQGKVRYFGCSGHDDDLMEVMDYALTIPEFSMVLNRINFKRYPEQPQLFKKAKAKGIGVTVMKTLAGARSADLAPFEGDGVTRKQAALKWVLSNPDLSGLVITMSSRQQVDEFALASASR